MDTAAAQQDLSRGKRCIELGNLGGFLKCYTTHYKYDELRTATDESSWVGTS